MKIIFILLPAYLISQNLTAQVKPSQKEVRTGQSSKKQMQAEMVSAINELNTQIADKEKQITEAKKSNEDPESIKEMEQELTMLKKQVAMMQGLNKSVSGMSDKMIQEATTDDQSTSTVPKRDAERIKMMPNEILSDAQLVPFFKNVVAEVEKKIPASDKAKASGLYDEMMKSKFNSPKILANIANTNWLNGYPEIALYIMGKVCLADMSNGNNLNNYAAFLTMEGGEHAALPILLNLNQKYPDNSTILNNIGQAWFGLGDMNNSKKYLDETMHFYSLHSQANLTNAKICASQGHTQEAIESIKRSIKENYTTGKEAELNDLGGKLQYDDIPFPYPKKAEPLGIEKFMLMIPAYPFEGGTTAEESQMEWDDFKEKVAAAKEPIEKKLEILSKDVEAYIKLLSDHPGLLLPYNTPPYKTANRKLVLLTDWFRDRLLDINKEYMAAGDSVEKWRMDYNDAIQNQKECASKKEAATNFLSRANGLYQQLNAKLVLLYKEYLNEQTSMSLYASSNRSQYKAAVETAKLHFLDILYGLTCYFEVGCAPQDPPEVQKKQLPDFDSVNCDFKDEIFIPPFTIMKFDCNRWTTEIGIELNFNYGAKVSPYVKFEIEENLRTGKTTKGTLEVGGEAGISEMEVGPLKGEAVVKGGAGIEITEHGIESVYVKGGVGSNFINNPEGAGVTNYAQISAQAEARMTWESGSEKIGGESGTSEGHFSSSAEIKVPLLESIKIGGGHK